MPSREDGAAGHGALPDGMSGGGLELPAAPVPGGRSPRRTLSFAASATFDRRFPPTYAALDLGTNNCRLLVARPTRDSFRVVDAFSRIVRLGEGLGRTGALSTAAIERAIGALQVCRDKLEARGVVRARLIATEACRAAANGGEFLAAVEERAGLKLEIVSRETEAGLAAAGCTPLVAPEADGVILFDIGGGSSEIVWLRVKTTPGGPPLARIEAWTSLPVGVVSLAERHGGHEVTPASFDVMVAEVAGMLDAFDPGARLARAFRAPHLLGTSGTVTTIAGVHLGLARYDRRQVDGLWLDGAAIDRVLARLIAMPFAARVADPCIGQDRADLVLAGCAIMEAIRRAYPCPRLRVADRGLREGILVELMRADGVWGRAREERR